MRSCLCVFINWNAWCIQSTVQHWCGYHCCMWSARMLLPLLKRQPTAVITSFRWKCTKHKIYLCGANIRFWLLPLFLPRCYRYWQYDIALCTTVLHSTQNTCVCDYVFAIVVDHIANARTSQWDDMVKCHHGSATGRQIDTIAAAAALCLHSFMTRPSVRQSVSYRIATVCNVQCIWARISITIQQIYIDILNAHMCVFGCRVELLSSRCPGAFVSFPFSFISSYYIFRCFILFFACVLCPLLFGLFLFSFQCFAPHTMQRQNCDRAPCVHRGVASQNAAQRLSVGMSPSRA